MKLFYSHKLRLYQISSDKLQYHSLYDVDMEAIEV